MADSAPFGTAAVRNLILAADGARVSAALAPLTTNFMTNADLAIVAATLMARAFIGHSDAENMDLSVTMLDYARALAKDEEALGAAPPAQAMGGWGTLSGDATVIRAPGNEHFDGPPDLRVVQSGGSF